MDAAASSLKPQSVIDAEMDFLQNRYANAGRGICARASAVDNMVANTRDAVRDFIGASKSDQIIFTSGTTDGMNKIAKMLKTSLSFDDNSLVMVSDLDHHSARMPFEEMRHGAGRNFAVCPLDKEFNIDTENIPAADVFVITAMSNVLGAPQDVKKIISAARAKNPDVITVVDAAQYVAYLPIDVADWDCDFLCFSGHKIGADTGVGIMYIKEPKKWFPAELGGGMVSRITGSDGSNDSRWIFMSAPEKFEAGTLPLTQIAGLVSAIRNQESGIRLRRCFGGQVRDQGSRIVRYLHDELSKIDRIKIITKPDAAVLTFVVDGMHVLDFGALVGASGVCIRVGNMCASWIHRLLGQDGTIRISCGFWNTMDEANDVIDIIKKILK